MHSITIPVVKALQLVVFASALPFLFGYTVEAQPTRSLANSARRIEEFNKQGDQAAREEMNREMRGKKPTAEEMRKAKAIEAQIREDLEILQSEYNNIVIKLQSGDQVADTFAVDTAGRIHKHAERLLSNIAFPESRDDEATQVETKKKPLNQRKQLFVICSHILEFFKSPLFESPNVLDVPNAMEARRKLQTIIQSSLELKNGQN